MNDRVRGAKELNHQSKIGNAENLKMYREKSGKTIKELADLLAISFESYRDLELHDDEILTAISFDQLSRLAESLNMSLRELFSGSSPAHVPPVSFSELADLIKRHILVHNMTVNEFENRTGWEIEKQLRQPQEFSRYNLRAFIDIGNEIAVDWVSLLPN